MQMFTKLDFPFIEFMIPITAQRMNMAIDYLN